MTDLKKLSQNCNFDEIKDSLIRDRIVCEICEIRVRDRLLRETHLNLNKCINICKASELVKLQFKQLLEESVVNVHLTKKKFEKRKELRKNDNIVNNCKYCGLNHMRNKCPAYRKMCRKCNKYNHFEKMCKFKKMEVVEKENDEIWQKEWNHCL